MESLPENGKAAYMRAYRAWKMGRGPKPAPRLAFVADFELQLEKAFGYVTNGAVDAERSWQELKRAIMAEGGIAPNADYSWNSIPHEVYRKSGKPADLMAVVLATAGFHYECDSELLCDVWKRFEDRKYSKEIGR